MLKNLDNLGEQTINRLATAALASQMQEAQSFSVNVKIDPQELSQGIVSSFAMEGKHVVTSRGFKATDFSLLIENISVHPFKALMGNIQLRRPALGNALLGMSASDLDDGLCRKLREIHTTLNIQDVSSKFIAPNSLQVQLDITEEHSSHSLKLAVNFIVGYDVHHKAIAFREIEYYQMHERLDYLCDDLQKVLLDLLNLNSLMFSGLEFSVKNIKIVKDNLELMAIAKIISFPKPV